MSDRIWHNGPPPHVGWWNASVNGNENIWRWWNGEYWSNASNPAEAAVRRAKYRSACRQDSIQWSDYWPADARVPRLDPTDGHWTFNTTGEQPKVEGLVEVVLRDGVRGTTSASRLHWELTSLDWGLVAWRPAK